MGAGKSERMGTPKMMLRYQEKTLIRHVIDAALDSDVDDVVVVINPEVEGLLAEATVAGVNKIFLNNHSNKGLSSSVKSGLYVLPAEVEAAIFLLGDQPLISSREINLLLEDFHADHEHFIYQSSYIGKRGHPVLFHRRMFNRLLEIKGDKGGRDLVKKNTDQVKVIEMGKNYPFDIDTIADYKKLLRKEVS
ncbi:nucleotidyltransferase family protein [Fictibacillus sp. B-59209]|uniref:nucleotidyltransferase family protein n=1 Tax=Fictibacillus sp. B-59209 TaxID=3024873 RepID=UPI002E1BB634|nr:nucleotidyltransferase family protein [Fictibacillus sp. B-59209]